MGVVTSGLHTRVRATGHQTGGLEKRVLPWKRGAYTLGQPLPSVFPLASVGMLGHLEGSLASLRSSDPLWV